MLHRLLMPRRRVGGYGSLVRRSRLTGLALALLATPAQAELRALSINLCTDHLLAAVADPSQVLGFSPYFRNPTLSAGNAAFARTKLLSGTAEEVLVLRPDLVLAGRFTRRATREMLAAHGVRVETFDVVRTLDDARTQLRRAGRLLHQEPRAEAQVAAIDAAVLRARRAAASRTLRVLPLQRRGWVSGQDSLMTSLLAEVGLLNAAGSGAGSQMSLEAIVAARPDLLLVGRDDDRAEDQGRAFLLHPALARLYPPDRRITLPERLTVCGGPALAEALDRLAEAVEHLPR